MKLKILASNDLEPALWLTISRLSGSKAPRMKLQTLSLATRTNHQSKETTSLSMTSIPTPVR